MSLIGTYTQNILDSACVELEREETKKKIVDKIISPFVEPVLTTFKYHYSIFVFLQLVIILLLVLILIKKN